MNWNLIENVTEMITNNGLTFDHGRNDDFTFVEPLNRFGLASKMAESLAKYLHIHKKRQ
jgi:hypothetical protein